MKFKITMKDPDGVYDSIQGAVAESVKPLDITDGERESIAEVRLESVNKQLGKWFKYGEYLEVEIDTDAMTCVVVPCK